MEHIQSRTHIKVLVVPELDELLRGDGEAVCSYPFHKTFEEAKFDPVIVLHTSGTTGLPKPIELKHGGLVTVDAHRALKPSKGYEGQLTALKDYTQLFYAFPPFHVTSADPVIKAHSLHFLSMLPDCVQRQPTNLLLYRLLALGVH